MGRGLKLRQSSMALLILTMSVPSDMFVFWIHVHKSIFPANLQIREEHFGHRLFQGEALCFHSQSICLVNFFLPGGSPLPTPLFSVFVRAVALGAVHAGDPH